MDSKKWPEARKKNNPFVPPKWEAAPEATRLRYEAQGIRILAQCGGCMNYLVEVEEVEER
jgi:hypothetical protein